MIINLRRGLHYLAALLYIPYQNHDQSPWGELVALCISQKGVMRAWTLAYFGVYMDTYVRPAA